MIDQITHTENTEAAHITGDTHIIGATQTTDPTQTTTAEHHFQSFMERRANLEPTLADACPETHSEDPEPESAISEAQLAANRANAKLSHGPGTPAGKAKSSRNNFRHGLTQNEGSIILLETESQDEYNEALLAFLDEWKPATPTERDLVERLARPPVAAPPRHETPENASRPGHRSHHRRRQLRHLPPLRSHARTRLQ